ncbi:MAG: CpsD/CapB family tyrosine-protein kinase [Desulfatibacillum sp.]|nr:CpsD/CapB family tyrosine-protein kinase [Desulfatibacillum sp.]
MKRKSENKQKRTLDLISLFLSNYQGKSRFAEAYRTLRTNVDLSFMEKDMKCLLVTSAGEAEGKTLTVANYSYNLAESGRSVLMVDADLRKPSLSKLMVNPEAMGVTGLLSRVLGAPVTEGMLGKQSVSDLIRLLQFQKKTGMLNLSSQKDNKAIVLYFLSGELVDCVWENCPEERSLPNHLVQLGLISSQQSKQAKQRALETGQNLPMVLVNAGILAKKQLRGPLKNQLAQTLRMALAMGEGQFLFKSTHEFRAEPKALFAIDLKNIYLRLVSDEESLPFINGGIISSILKTPQPGLFLLPSGVLPPNPSELLGSARMLFLLSRFKDLFDVVILDSPPILPASDALTLAPHVDGVLFVVKAGGVNRDLVKKAVDQLAHAKANLVGVVLNQVDVHREGYYKYYEKYYSSYYGS